MLILIYITAIYCLRYVSIVYKNEKDEYHVFTISEEDPYEYKLVAYYQEGFYVDKFCHRRLPAKITGSKNAVAVGLVDEVQYEKAVNKIGGVHDDMDGCQEYKCIVIYQKGSILPNIWIDVTENKGSIQKFDLLDDGTNIHLFTLQSGKLCCYLYSCARWKEADIFYSEAEVDSFALFKERKWVGICRKDGEIIVMDINGRRRRKGSIHGSHITGKSMTAVSDRVVWFKDSRGMGRIFLWDIDGKGIGCYNLTNI